MGLLSAVDPVAFGLAFFVGMLAVYALAPPPRVVGEQKRSG